MALTVAELRLIAKAASVFPPGHGKDWWVSKDLQESFSATNYDIADLVKRRAKTGFA